MFRGCKISDKWRNKYSRRGVVFFNLRALLHFYSIRSKSGSQWEIKFLAEELRKQVTVKLPWLEEFFINI